MSLNELDNVVDERLTACGVVDHLGVLTPQGVIPTTNGNQNFFHPLLLESNNPFIEVVVNIRPAEKKR